MNGPIRAFTAGLDSVKSGTAADSWVGPYPQRTVWAAGRVAAAIVALGLLLGGCFFSETYQRGYIVPDGALEQIPLGSTQVKTLLMM